MKLTLQQLNAAVDGVPRIIEEADGTFFLERFTEEQRSYQYDPESGFYGRTFSTPGGKLDFTTDSETLSVSLTRCVSKSSVLSCGIDVWQNGILTHHFQRETADLPNTPDGRELGDWSETVALLPGTKRVELFFPRNARYAVREISLDDGSTFEPTVHRRRMIVFGDSITAACSTVFPSLAYISLVSRAIDARTFNYAVGGEAYKARCVVPGTYPDADFLLVAYGTNGRRDPEKWRENMPAFFEALHKEFPDKPTFVILPIHRMGEEQPAASLPLPEARARIREACAKYANITVLNGEKYVPWDEAMYQDKVLHPNDLGMAHYARNLLADLKPLLK